jgi:acetoin utilization deacetylase AcuC-like enzyme
LTGLVYDAECLDHDNGSMILNPRARDWISVPHSESPERISRTYQVLERSGRLAKLGRLECPLVDEATLRLVHSPAMVENLKAACSGDELVWVGPEARVGPKSWRPALKAAGGAVAALDAVLSGALDNVYVLVRPPGHHASATVPMGFCLFNNVAIACRHAQQRRGVEKVAIVDWDVHHGNGTQAIFYEDPQVLFISLHQDGLYPLDTGTLRELGSGRGEGFNVNVPLPAGSSNLGYAAAFESVVEPIVRQFSPDLILVSAGQDASGADPLGRMSLTTEGFRDMATRLTALAQDVCDGRLIAVQEGGYSPDHLPYCTLAIIEAMAGLEPALAGDPLEMDVPAKLQSSEVEAVRAAREAHGAYWLP